MKAAVIGLGPMGRRLMQAISRVKGLELVAVADLRPEVLEEVEDGSIQRFTSSTQLFSAVDVDLAVVATNAPSHHPIVMQAIRAGVKRIFCEKPMACSVDQAREMVTEARKSRVRLAVNHNKRHIPAYRWLAKRLASGEWGEVLDIITTCRGAGLGCLGVHFFDQIRYFSGDEFTKITAWLDPEIRENPRGPQFHDPGGLVAMEGVGGRRYIHHQMEESAGPEHILIDTSVLRIRIEEMFTRVEVIRRDFSVRPGPGRPPKFDTLALPDTVSFSTDVIALSAEVMKNLLSNDEPVVCDGIHGLRSLEVVIAAHLSHQRGNIPVALPLEKQEDRSLELPIT